MGFGPRGRLTGQLMVGSICRGLRARKGLPQTIDGAGDGADLLGQSFRVSLLCCEQAFDALQLFLQRLELVDGFLLRYVQRLGLFHQLLGCFCGAKLHLPGR